MWDVGKLFRNMRAVFSKLYLMYALLSWCTCMFSGKSWNREIRISQSQTPQIESLPTHLNITPEVDDGRVLQVLSVVHIDLLQRRTVNHIVGPRLVALDGAQPDRAARVFRRWIRFGAATTFPVDGRHRECGSPSDRLY